VVEPPEGGGGDQRFEREYKDAAETAAAVGLPQLPLLSFLAAHVATDGGGLAFLVADVAEAMAVEEALLAAGDVAVAVVAGKMVLAIGRGVGLVAGNTPIAGGVLVAALG